MKKITTLNLLRYRCLPKAEKNVFKDVSEWYDTFKPFWAILLFCGVVAPLSGCSGFKIAYNFSYGYIEEKASFYLDQNSSDKEFLLLKIRQFMRWHKTIMLPRYAQFLEEEASIIESNQLTKESAVNSINRARRLLAETVVGAAPYISSVLMRHTSPSKIGYLKRRLGEDIKEKQKKLTAPPLETVGERTEKIIDRIERFTGALDELQAVIVVDYVKDTQFFPPYWIENREKRQLALIQFLASNPEKPETTAFVEHVLLHFNKSAGGDPNKIVARWRSRISRLLYDLLRSLANDQREELLSSLRKYALDMRELSQ
ncbi:MAG: hypothetical protein CMF70_11050 [Magnetovibrio sp.]|nr:hypothetical protein [Magnetovibrio sp.]